MTPDRSNGRKISNVRLPHGDGNDPGADTPRRTDSAFAGLPISPCSVCGHTRRVRIDTSECGPCWERRVSWTTPSGHKGTSAPAKHVWINLGGNQIPTELVLHSIDSVADIHRELATLNQQKLEKRAWSKTTDQSRIADELVDGDVAYSLLDPTPKRSVEPVMRRSWSHCEECRSFLLNELLGILEKNVALITSPMVVEIDKATRTLTGNNRKVFYRWNRLRERWTKPCFVCGKGRKSEPWNTKQEAHKDCFRAVLSRRRYAAKRREELQVGDVQKEEKPGNCYNVSGTAAQKGDKVPLPKSAKAQERNDVLMPLGLEEFAKAAAVYQHELRRLEEADRLDRHEAEIVPILLAVANK